MDAADSPPAPVTLISALGSEPLGPLLLARFAQADRVVLVGRPSDRWRVEPLLAAFQRDRCVATWAPLDAADVPTALNELDRMLPGDERASLVFDLTNAYGLVGITLYTRARQEEQTRPARTRVLRIDWSDGLVRTISPDLAESSELNVRLSVKEFLALYGKRILGAERMAGSESPFGGAARLIAKALPAARSLLDSAHRGAWDRPLHLRRRHANVHLVDMLIERGLLQRDGNRVRASNMRAFEFLHGRWLESYVFDVADQSGCFDDCASGVRFIWQEEQGGTGEVENEIDFVGTAGGRATVGSCKTGFREAAAPLYELLTLAERAAGRSVVAVFVTSVELDGPARRRASALGVRVIDSRRLGDEDYVLHTLLGDGLRRSSSHQATVSGRQRGSSR